MTMKLTIIFQMFSVDVEKWKAERAELDNYTEDIYEYTHAQVHALVVVSSKNQT